MLESITALEVVESKILPDAAATEKLGSALAKVATPSLVIYLEGELGAGKTTFVRGFLRGLGYTGTVKSPTFTVVEEYAFGERVEKLEFKEKAAEADADAEARTVAETGSGPKPEFVYHFDLYRLEDPEALEFMGIREYLHEKALVLIEWPEKGVPYLPQPDLILQLASSSLPQKNSARSEKNLTAPNAEGLNTQSAGVLSARTVRVLFITERSLMFKKVFDELPCCDSEVREPGATL